MLTSEARYKDRMKGENWVWVFDNFVPKYLVRTWRWGLHLAVNSIYSCSQLLLYIMMHNPTIRPVGDLLSPRSRWGGNAVELHAVLSRIRRLALRKRKWHPTIRIIFGTENFPIYGVSIPGYKNYVDITPRLYCWQNFLTPIFSRSKETKRQLG